MGKADERKSYPMYKVWHSYAFDLPPEQALELIQAIFNHQDGKEVNIKNPLLNAIFLNIRKVLDEDSRKYEETCVQNSINGQKSAAARARKKEIAKEKENDVSNVVQRSLTVVGNSKQLSAVSNDAQHDNDNDYDNDNDNDNVNDNVNDKSDKKHITANAKKIIAAWNSDPLIIHVREIRTGSKRDKALKARIKTYGLDTVLDAVERVKNSKFCHGGGAQGWIADFDWFVRPDTINKILEGKYDDTKSKSSKNQYLEVIKDRVDVVDSWV